MNKKNVKQYSSILRNIAIGVFSSIIATGILNLFGYFNININIIIGLIMLCIILIILLLMKRKKNEIGIDCIYTKEANPSLDDYITSITSSFYFWGISANRTVNNINLREKLVKIGHKNGEIKFLLLDPNSSTLERKAKDENVDPDNLRKDIQATIQRLKSYVEKYNIKIEIRFYTDFPIWRLCVIDNKKIYLNYFLSNQQGPESPLIEIRPVSNGIFGGFIKEFNETWGYRSKPVK